MDDVVTLGTWLARLGVWMLVVAGAAFLLGATGAPVWATVPVLLVLIVVVALATGPPPEDR